MSSLSTIQFVVIFSCFGFISGQRCPSKETLVPKKANFEAGPDEYPLIESALQIYTHIRIPCDGYLYEWKFLVGPDHLVAGLHLGVFRPRQNGFFDLVGRSHFVVMTTPPNSTWITHNVKQRISVKRGDCLGIFYDKFETTSKQLTIRSKLVPSTYITRHFPTYVMALDETVLRKNRTVDVRAATREFRSPALAASISSDAPQPSAPHKSSKLSKQLAITAPSDVLLHTVELALVEKAKQQTTEQPATSTTPSTSISSSTSSTQPPSTPTSTLTTETATFDTKCSQSAKVPPNFVKLPIERYPFAETSLQIFSSMTVECDGYLSAWHFLATSELIEGVHLAIFRRRSPAMPHLLTLVEETHVVNMKHPISRLDQRAIWVTYLPEHPITVKTGDVVGIFYDNYRIPSEMAAILSQADDDFSSSLTQLNKPSPTFVFLIDGQTLSSNDTVDIREAAKSYRQPALAATVEPLGFVRNDRG